MPSPLSRCSLGEGGSELAPVSAVSRKTHGTAGDFDVNLPLTGPAGIECRKGGGTNSDTHQVIMTFPVAVTVTSAGATPDPNQAGATGSVSSFSVSGAQVTVNLVGVSNAQKLNITLSNVSDGVNTSSTLTVPMGVLAGDTTANGAVSSSDIAQTQSQSGQPVTSSNFREDVTVNGSINSSDIAFVQSKSSTALSAGTSQSEENPTTTAPKHRGSPGKSF